MKRILLSLPLVLTATATALHAANLPDNLNRLSFGPRVGFNIKAQFSNNPLPFTANPALPFDPQKIPVAGVEYNDGYVYVDSSGNAGGTTWNWGYDNSLVEQRVGGTMEFHATGANAAAGPSSSEAEDNPQYGGELIYQRLIAPVGESELWGLEAAFSFTDLDIDQRTNGAGPGRSSPTASR